MVPATIMQIRIMIFFLVIKGSVSLVWVWTKKGHSKLEVIIDKSALDLCQIEANTII